MSTKTALPSHALKGAAIIGLIFGGMTVFSGGSVLFGPDQARELAGAYVPFVVWFNFLAGFAYIATAILILRRHRLAKTMATLIAAATALVAAIFTITALQGGAFEMRTVGALVLRFGIWAVIAFMLMKNLTPKAT